MRVLVYVRQWNKEFYTKIVNRAFDNPQIDIISDFRGKGDIWTGNYIYNEMLDYEDSTYELQKKDIITRCRFLRSISFERSERLSRRFWNGINKLFEEREYDLVVSPLIDCYTMDIIERLATLRGVQYFSLVTFFVTGYSRFTKRGELYDAKRDVDDEEIKNVLDMLTNDAYKVTYELNKERTSNEVFKFYVRRRLIETFYFPLKKLMSRDWDNYHYNTCSFTTGKYLDYSPIHSKNYFFLIDDVKFDGNEVYVPLHYSPEATVDYWCDDAKFAYYEESLIDVIKKSDKEIKFILKEHPAMYGKRSKEFYSKLAEMPNVCLIHPYENSNLLLSKVQNVLVYTGSVGVEALLRGKRVFTVTDNYYVNSSDNIIKKDYLKIEDLTYEALQNDNQKTMRHILQGVFLGKTSAGYDIDKSDFEQVADELRRIYELHEKK